MAVDVEQQLAALGKFWQETIADVEVSEIISRDAARSNGSTTGVEGLAAAPSAYQPRRMYQFTEEEATMIDLETQSRTDEQRQGPKRFLVAGLVAAAAVVAIALVAVRDDEPEAPADQPATTLTVPPTRTTAGLFGVPGEQLAAGTYSIDDVEGIPTPQILVTIGDGWSTFDDWGSPRATSTSKRCRSAFPTESSSTPATRAMGTIRGRSTPWTASSQR